MLSDSSQVKSERLFLNLVSIERSFQGNCLYVQVGLPVVVVAQNVRAIFFSKSFDIFKEAINFWDMETFNLGFEI